MFAPYRSPPPLISPLLAGTAYFFMASLALVCSRFDGGLAFIWAANALLMAELLSSRTEYWPRVILACGIASMISTALFGMGPLAAAPMALINIAESLIVAACCRWFVSAKHMSSASKQPLLVFVLALCGPANILMGLLAALVASALTPVSFGASWLHWYSGHVLGGLTCAPVLIMLLEGRVSRWIREASVAEKLEAICLLLFLAAATYHVFYIAHYPMLFALLMPLVLIAFRTGYIGTAAAIVLVTIIGGTATITGHGPLHLVAATIGQRTQFFQLFLAFSFLLTMPIAAELHARRRLFQMLQESEARYRAIAEHSGDVVLNVSVSGVIEYASPSAAEHVGCAPDMLVGQEAAILVDPEHRQEVVRAHRRALASPGDSQTVEFRPNLQAAGLDWCEMVTRAVLDERGIPTGVVSTIRDMSRHKARQRALQKVAAVDMLTGADSRWAFLEKLDQEIQRVTRGGKACLVLADVDHFKAVNDRYGHGVGDRVLAAFVEHLRPGLRGVDSIGRLGGEEFGILLSGTDIERASAVCERLRHMVAAHRTTIETGETIAVTFSAGLVELDGLRSRSDLLEAADKALYQAKHGGRNCLRLAA
ncbi:sensor domain-containing diguanylate cyclase [Sphingobium mellinum]|uniref:sensor domain-containing diguanylate cyclase n=1 Tax=Sphingobium mellinum TaxID=1387166 RepID=UPI0030EDEC62